MLYLSIFCEISSILIRKTVSNCKLTNVICAWIWTEVGIQYVFYGENAYKVPTKGVPRCTVRCIVMMCIFDPSRMMMIQWKSIMQNQHDYIMGINLTSTLNLARFKRASASPGVISSSLLTSSLLSNGKFKTSHSKYVSNVRRFLAHLWLYRRFACKNDDIRSL